MLGGVVQQMAALAEAAWLRARLSVGLWLRWAQASTTRVVRMVNLVIFGDLRNTRPLLSRQHRVAGSHQRPSPRC
jgi:hypothetical protein